MIYERIRNLREDNDLTQTKLAVYYDVGVDCLLELTDEKKPYKTAFCHALVLTAPQTRLFYSL